MKEKKEAGRRGSEWVCPDLTDSGLGVKTRKAPMKTRITKPVCERTSYTKEYKQEEAGRCR